MRMLEQRQLKQSVLKSLEVSIGCYSTSEEDTITTGWIVKKVVCLMNKGHNLQ